MPVSDWSRRLIETMHEPFSNEKRWGIAEEFRREAHAHCSCQCPECWELHGDDLSVFVPDDVTEVVLRIGVAAGQPESPETVALSQKPQLGGGEETLSLEGL